MVTPAEGAACDLCLMECPAHRKGRGWAFPCDEDTRMRMEARRILGRWDADDDELMRILQAEAASSRGGEGIPAPNLWQE